MGPSLAGEGWGAVATEHNAFSGPIHLLLKGEHVWRWFPAPGTTSKAPGPRKLEAAQTILSPRASRGLGEKPAKRCFPEPTRFGADLGFPGRVSLLRMQLPESSFVPFLRWARGGSLPSWRRVGCCGHGTQCLFRPHPTSPQRGAHLEVISSSGDHQQSTSGQGAGSSPDPPRP